GPEHQRGGKPDGDSHVERGIRKGQVDRADLAKREVVDDLELMDRIGHSAVPSVLIPTLRPRCRQVASSFLLSGGTPSSLPSAACGGGGGGGEGAPPPAHHPSPTRPTRQQTKNTHTPRRERRTRGQSPHRIPAPTGPPATSALESPNPRANPDASAAGRPRSTPDGWA